jgi:hypothetical protein
VFCCGDTNQYGIKLNATIARNLIEWKWSIQRTTSISRVLITAVGSYDLQVLFLLLIELMHMNNESQQRKTKTRFSEATSNFT